MHGCLISWSLGGSSIRFIGPLRFPGNTGNLIFGKLKVADLMRIQDLHVSGIIILEYFILALFSVYILWYRLRILVVILFIRRWVRHTQIAIAIVVLRNLFQIPCDIELLDLA